MTIELTEAEMRMTLEAVAMWASELSAQRHAINEERIKSVLLKLTTALE